MKKIVCILLCLMMILPSAFSLAAVTDTPITDVKITLTLPKAETTVGDNYPAIKLSDGSCHVHETFWAYADTSVPEGYAPYYSDHVFKAGEEMLVWINIAANTGYCFDDSTSFTANSKVTVYDRIISSDGAYAFITLKFTVAAPKPTVKVTLPTLKGVKLTALSNKRLKITWKKLSKKDQKKIQKIQVEVSTDKNFKKIVKRKYLSSRKSSWAITGLKKGKRYYVRVRAYTKSGNVIKVSKWVVKCKKTKK